MIVQKLLVLFPGIGYTCDRPLLYYAKKIAQNNGFTVIALDYGSTFSGNSLKNLSEETAKIGLKACEQQIQNIPFEAYDRIIFVSKSIGTLMAYLAEQKIKQSCKLTTSIQHIYLTPIEACFQYIKSADTVMIGGKDQYATHEAVYEFRRATHAQTFLFENANHSLEVNGNIQQTLDILNHAVNEMAKIIR